MTPTETTREFFNRTALQFQANYRSSPDFRERYRVWHHAIEAALSGLSSQSVCLDLGCGDGVFGRLVASKGIRTIGIDQSEAMLQLARRLDAEAGVACSTYERASIPLGGDLERLYGGMADLIICSSALEYVSDYKAALGQCVRLLTPNGRLLLSLPNRRSIYRAVERAVRGFVSHRDNYLQHQLHQFDLAETRALLSSLGFRVVGTSYFSLPMQSCSERIFGRYRGPWLATMFLITAERGRKS